MEEIILSKNTFEGLLNHLVDLEDRQNKIVEDFSIQTPGDNELTSFFQNYIRELRIIVEKARTSKINDDSMPIITVGSMVQVYNLDNQKNHNFHLVSPNQNRAKRGDVSCLSPVGKSLLGKKVGDEVTVIAPRGEYKYRVQSIEYVGE